VLSLFWGIMGTIAGAIFCGAAIFGIAGIFTGTGTGHMPPGQTGGAAAGITIGWGAGIAPV